MVVLPPLPRDRGEEDLRPWQPLQERKLLQVMVPAVRLVTISTATNAIPCRAFSREDQ